MNLYVDSSSILKLFLDEVGSHRVREQVASTDSLSTALISWPEARAGLARALRGLRLSDQEHQVALSRLAVDIWPRFDVVDLDTQVATSAGDLAARYFLRGLDAIHLASALTLQEGLGETVSLSSFDSRLNEAAADCGLAVV